MTGYKEGAGVSSLDAGWPRRSGRGCRAAPDGVGLGRLAGGFGVFQVAEDAG